MLNNNDVFHFLSNFKRVCKNDFAFQYVVNENKFNEEAYLIYSNHFKLVENFYRDDFLFENKRIMKELLPVASDIAKELLRTVAKILLESHNVPKLPVYTGWNYVSRTDRDKENLLNDSILKSFYKLDDEKKFHPIKLKYVADNNNRNIKMWTDAFKQPLNGDEEDLLFVDFVHDDIIIYINVLGFLYLLKPNDFFLVLKEIEGILVHELTHISDKHARETINPLTDNPGSLFIEFQQHPALVRYLETDESSLLFELSYVLSYNE